MIPRYFSPQERPTWVRERLRSDVSRIIEDLEYRQQFLVG